MYQTFCPECDHPFKLNAHSYENQRISCPECRANLIVVSLSPPEVDIDTQPVQTPGAKKKARAIEVACVECDTLFKVKGNLHIGQRIICTACKTPMELISLNPVEVDLATPVNAKRNRQKNFDSKKQRHKKTDGDFRRRE